MGKIEREVEKRLAASGNAKDQPELDDLDEDAYQDQAHIKKPKDQFPMSKIDGPDSFDKAIEKKMADEKKMAGKNVFDGKFKGVDFTIYKDGYTHTYKIQGKTVNKYSYDNEFDAKKGAERYIAENGKSMSSGTEEADNTDEKKMAAAVFPVDKALAELKQKCDRACEEVASKYGAQPLAARASKYASEVEYSVGLEWR